MHRTVVYPNGMVEVFLDDEEAAELGCYGVEDTEQEMLEATEVDPVSDALDVLDARFSGKEEGYFRGMVHALRSAHNASVWNGAGHEPG